VTCLAARVDGDERRLTYANAGHPAGLVAGAGRPRMLEPGGPPLGLFPATVYSSVGVALQPEDVGVIVTDGITEALEGGSAAPAAVLAAIATRRASPAEPEQICDEIMRAAEAGAAAPSLAAPDDRTVVVFAVDGRAGD
jgi:serine phosphatase RsbU (regulator of sigma subunit)